jgi:hypothetical protein
MPLFVMIAVVAGLTLNCSAMNFTHAVKGASSGTEIVRNGRLGSDALVILKVTFWDSFFCCCCSVSLEKRDDIKRGKVILLSSSRLGC